MNPYAPPSLTALPTSLPVFPLNVLLLPGAFLPLNIFEPRYLAMIRRVLGSHRLIGMVHPADDSAAPTLLPLGCAGKIVRFEESTDGRFEIVLAGVSRFAIRQEEPLDAGGFRRVQPDWAPYAAVDTASDDDDFALDRPAIAAALQDCLRHQSLQLNAKALERLPNAEFLRVTAMNSPLPAFERQMLLATSDPGERAEQLLALLDAARTIMRAAATDGDADEGASAGDR